KRTVPARIGLEKSVTLYEILVGFALVLLAVLAASRLISWVALIGLIASIPLARARSVLRVHYREYPAHIPANAGTIQAVLFLGIAIDRKSTRLNSSHVSISYAVFCLK